MATPLSWASFYGQTRMVYTLLHAGADPTSLINLDARHFIKLHNEIMNPSSLCFYVLERL